MINSPSTTLTFEELQARHEAARTLASIEELIWHSNARNEVCCVSARAASTIVSYTPLTTAPSRASLKPASTSRRFSWDATRICRSRSGQMLRMAIVRRYNLGSRLVFRCRHGRGTGGTRRGVMQAVEERPRRHGGVCLGCDESRSGLRAYELMIVTMDGMADTMRHSHRHNIGLLQR